GGLRQARRDDVSSCPHFSSRHRLRAWRRIVYMEFDPDGPLTPNPDPKYAVKDQRSIRRHGRWLAFAVYGRRCRFCKRGILWIRNQNGIGRKGQLIRVQVAIEPETWEGEEWYWKGKHRWHGFRCEGMRKARNIDGQKMDRKHREYLV